MIKKLLGIAIIFAIVGYFVPLGSYTETRGCPIEPTPTIRLHYVKGDRLAEVRNRPMLPNAGCAPNAKYTLYFF